MIKLRDYQERISSEACEKLIQLGIVYLSMEVRTGKTLTALTAAMKFGAKKVLFLTKLRGIASIQDDYGLLSLPFEITIINNESLHKVKTNDFDLLISDEHHRLSAFPNPNKTTKMVKERFGRLPMIFLSGTPAIESGSQWYHSFWLSYRSPFKMYTNFYKWSKDFVTPKIRYLGAIQVPDYSASKDGLILPIVEPYLIKYTQEQAGFVSKIEENVIYSPMTEKTNYMIKTLLKDKILTGLTDTIIGDTAAKLLSKVHQLSNGTVILESGKAIITDTTKAEFIRRYFAGKKMGIFYFFIKEYELLKQVFGNQLTNDMNEFNTTDKHIALQQVSGSEAISLKNADVLVYYSFGYSGKNYVQGRDRMTTKERERNNVYFVFEKKSINERIYKVIKEKKRYSTALFERQYGTRTKVTDPN